MVYEFSVPGELRQCWVLGEATLEASFFSILSSHLRAILSLIANRLIFREQALSQHFPGFSALKNLLVQSSKVQN